MSNSQKNPHNEGATTPCPFLVPGESTPGVDSPFLVPDYLKAIFTFEDECEVMGSYIREVANRTDHSGLSWQLDYDEFSPLTITHSLLLFVTGSVATHPEGPDGEGGTDWHFEEVEREFCLNVEYGATVAQVAAIVVDSLRTCVTDALNESSEGRQIMETERYLEYAFNHSR